MAITVNRVKAYIENEMNVLISGPAGTGKTSILQEAVKQLGMKMKYFSAQTLDPYVDLTGVPVPDLKNKTLELLRPREIDEADVIMFDELNRADDKTLNALFELIQFRSINGEKLPNLKCVVSAINPNDGDYAVNDMDIALVDRFDVYMTANAHIDMPYFKKKFGINVASVVNSVWNDYEKKRVSASRNSRNETAYISPRRMEKIVSNFMVLPSVTTISETLPPNVNIVPMELYTKLTNAIKGNAIKETPKLSGIEKLIASDSLRTAAKRKQVEKFLSKESTTKDETERLIDACVEALKVNISPANIVNNWTFLLVRLSDLDIKKMTNNWSYQKRLQMRRELLNTGNQKLKSFAGLFY